MTVLDPIRAPRRTASEGTPAACPPPSAAERLRAAFARRCRQAVALRSALLLTADGADGGLRPSAVWPSGSHPPLPLLKASVRASQAARPVLEPLDVRAPEGPRVFAARIAVAGQTVGVIAVVLDGEASAVARELKAWQTLQPALGSGDRVAGVAAGPQAPSAAPVSQAGDAQGGPTAAAPPHAERPPAGPDGVGAPDEAARLLESQAVIAEARDLEAALAGWVSAVARRFACRRVAFGWRSRAGSRVVALSDSAAGAPGPDVGAPLAMAMDEALDQQCPVAWPARPGARAAVTLGQAQVARLAHCAAVCSVPLFAAGRPVGALCLEREDRAFEPAELEALERLAAFAAPMLALRRRADRPLHGLAVRARERLSGPGHGVRLLVLITTVAAGFALTRPVADPVSAPARVEGAVQRQLTAPVDGWLLRAHVRPGDPVRADQVLVELDDRDVALERLRWHTEAQQADRQATEALAREDRGQYAVHAARAAQARAQRGLADAHLARLQVRAPFDGLVLAGDLTQALGAPVRAGDTLLTVAPGDRHRVIVEVDERDIERVVPGRPGVVALTARAGATVALEVVRIAPAAQAREGRTFFEVEARPLGDAPLRPGYQGVARLEAEPRRLAAALFERPWRRVADALWAWGW